MSTLSITLSVVAGTFVLVVGAGYYLTRRTSRAAAAAPAPAVDAAFSAPPPPVAAAREARAIAAPRETASSITWPSLVDETIGDLPFEERLKLVSRLAIVGDEWTLPILRRAVHEEHDPGMIDALVDALILKRGV